MVSKKYFLIFSTLIDKVDWSQLYAPEKWDLILFSLPIPGLFQNFQTKRQEKYFSKIIHLQSIEYQTLKKQFEEFISDLSKLGVQRNQIEIINDGEACKMKAARLREDFNLNGPKPEQIR